MNIFDRESKIREGETWKDAFKSQVLLNKWINTIDLCRGEFVEEGINREEINPVKLFGSDHNIKFENPFPEYDFNSKGWCLYAETDRSANNWGSLVSKSPVGYRKVRLEMLIVKNDSATGYIVIGAIFMPKFKEIRNMSLSSYIGRTNSSFGIFSAYDGYYCGSNHTWNISANHFSTGFIVGLEMDPIERHFKFFLNNKQKGDALKWDSINGLQKEALIHPAISLHSGEDVRIKLRVV